MKPIRSRAHLSLVFLLFAMRPAEAGWHCVDWSGRTYRSAEPIGSSNALQCIADETTTNEMLAKNPASDRNSAPASTATSGMGVAMPPDSLVSEFARTHGKGMLALAEPSPVQASGGLLALASVASADNDRGVRFDALIHEVANHFRHDAALIRAIVQVESGFNANAISPAGAIGLMQVLPTTAAWLGVANPKQSLMEPATNLYAGAHYLRRLIDLFPGRLDLAVAAYNAGQGAVLRHRGVPPYPETRRYVRAVLDRYERLRSESR
ncbi:lytic transglycosylase domain-containing protein [Paucibacter sp. PLA-PC-4]|uniref:lytic transglycosylase domain-containing protein n=1 Tax=Paucibacter sp. PLA-PC-4 TaxID=2993655 RepID=UPI00224B6B64|nr:lytic transglycosylase domain-containing protein [Paucibacter sp. PLA-PC-4]MCX2865583.1 lytic transglycosylase domain-containing protein [Paucibacter sp. PLA-PC-4]